MIFIPCYNEEITIYDVVKDYQENFPGEQIIVIDNNSTDATASEAKRAGAVVDFCGKKGKGEIFKYIFFKYPNEEFYLFTDGDGTYPGAEAKKLLEKIEKGDMITGRRQGISPLHLLYNRFVCFLINKKYHGHIHDAMTGLRIIKEPVSSIKSSGFEIETELTILFLQQQKKIMEIPVKYEKRPKNSRSKVKVFSDGQKILKFIMS